MPQASRVVAESTKTNSDVVNACLIDRNNSERHQIDPSR